MLFDRAVESSSKFLGYDLDTDFCQWQSRQGLTQADVSLTEDGLRLLAADGNWSEVVSLGATLEKIAAQAAQNRAPVSDGADGMQETTRIAVLGARLPYILVQVTAFFKMQRVEEAKRILDTLGDIESDDFLDPVTHEKLVPFSLRFLYSLIPFYMSDPMETFRRLYRLLDEQQSCVLDSPCFAKARRISQRVQRIQRTLVYVYYTTGRFDLAIKMFQKMIDWEGITSAFSTDTNCMSRLEKIRCALQLQQFACLCLHCGDTVFPEQAFSLISRISNGNCSRSFPSGDFGRNSKDETDSTSSLEAYLHAHIINMNEGFKLVISGRFTEATECFRSIALRISKDVKDHSLHKSSNPIGASSLVMDTLTEAVLHQLKANSETSHCSTLLYCVQDSGNAENFMAEIRDTLENYLRENPSFLSHSDAFLSNLARVYALCGESKGKLEQLAAVLEVFRCDAASLPNLEKMI